MKVIGIIIVILSVGTVVGGIVNWAMGGADAWPYLLIPIGPFIWGILQLTKGKEVEVVSMSPEQIETFQKENCINCQFANEDAMKNGEYPWCERPITPEFDKKLIHCLSRKEKERNSSVSMPR